MSSNDNKVLFEDSKVTIHKNEITSSLVGKLSNEDIALSESLINDMRDKRNLLLDLITGKGCKNCQELNNDYLLKCGNKPIPYGNTSSDVVFVKRVPSVLECACMLSHSDTAGHFLMLIIKKMGFNPDDFYYTDFIKCPNQNITVDACWNCVVNYFLKEIHYIKPKAIVFEGLAIVKTLSQEKILLNLPDALEYGIVYDSFFINENFPVKIVGIYDLDMVLQKEGDDLQQCKNVLWLNVQNIIKLVKQL